MSTEKTTDPRPYIDVAIDTSRRHATMTFEELVKGCTPREREQLAWHLAQMRARRTWEALRTSTCAAIPVDPGREAKCCEPYHWDDGVPYCDTCGLYRNTIHREEKSRARHRK